MTKKISIANAIAISILVSSCGFKDMLVKKDEVVPRPLIPEYVAIAPVSLPPLAPEIKSDLREIAAGASGTKDVPFDTDLLVLPIAVSKVQYRFFEVDGKLDAGGLASAGGTQESRRAIYDVMHMASYPLLIKLTRLKADGSFDAGAGPLTVVITPHIGVGVRVVADYNAVTAKAGISLTALAAEIQAKNGRGSIEIQQVGISRYGANNQGVAGMELTPSSLETALRSIGHMLGQVWLSDTRVQPSIVGYSIPGGASIDFAYHPQIVEQLVDRRNEIVEAFGASMFHEAMDAYKISEPLHAKSNKPEDTKALNDKLALLRTAVGKRVTTGNVLAATALERPDLIKFATPEMVRSYITAPESAPEVIKGKLFSDLESIKSRVATSNPGAFQ